MIALPLDLLDAIRAGQAPWRLFVELDHPDGLVRLWSGLGQTTWNDAAWLGAAYLGTIEGVTHTGDLRENEVAFTMSQVDPRWLNLSTFSVRNRPATIWCRWMRTDGTFWDSSLIIWKGLMDYASTDEAEAKLTITARSPIADWRVAANVAWTNEEQQALYPGDTGLDRIPGLVNKEFEGWALS